MLFSQRLNFQPSLMLMRWRPRSGCAKGANGLARARWMRRYWIDTLETAHRNILIDRGRSSGLRERLLCCTSSIISIKLRSKTWRLNSNAERWKDGITEWIQDGEMMIRRQRKRGSLALSKLSSSAPRMSDSQGDDSLFKKLSAQMRQFPVAGNTVRRTTLYRSFSRR